jgi:hypothetical protein
MNGGGARVEQTSTIEFTQNGHDAAGAMHILHVNVVFGRRHFAQTRHAT